MKKKNTLINRTLLVCFVAGAPNGFYEIYYMGEYGYSLADYLEFQ